MSKDNPSESYTKALEHAALLFSKVTGQNANKKNHTIEYFIDGIYNFYENLLACMPANIYWWSHDNRCLGVNNNVIKLMGVKSKYELIGKTYQEFSKIGNWEAGQAEFFENEDKQVMKDNAPKLSVNEDVPVKSPDGKQIYYSTNRVPLHDSKGKVIGVVGISVDISEIKTIQKKLEIANKTKSEFIANMSHDLRTPITGIMGMLQDLLYAAEDMQSNSLDSPSIEFIDRIQNNANIALVSVNELLQLFNEILEVIRLESGKEKVSPISFDVYQMIHRNCDLLTPVAKHKKLDLSVEIDERTPRYLNGIRHYLDRSLLNLISNALKFTEKGGVKIQVSLLEPLQAEYKKGERINLQVSIEDTGIGIPKDKFSTIFENFSRLTASYQGTYKGSGLGLFTVKRYIEAMQGEITVSSTVGKGSCFKVTLPLLVDDHSDHVSNKMQTLTPTINLPIPTNAKNAKKSVTTHILLVEDNPTAAMAAVSTLKRLNCFVQLATSGKEAIEKAEQEFFDLIFMDIGLPDLDGIAVTKKIRSLKNKTKAQVPIVALTGHAGDEQKQSCLDAGMQEVLNKPAQPALLQATVEKWTEKTSKVCVLDIENNSSPEIDWEGCLKLYNNQIDFVKQLLTLVAKELKRTNRILIAAYCKNDTETMKYEVVYCLGGVVYLKLPKLEKNLKALQILLELKHQNQEEIAKIYNNLLNEIQLFDQAYENLIHKI